MTRNTPRAPKKEFTLFRNEKHPLMAITGLVAFSLAVVSYAAFTGDGRAASREIAVEDARSLIVADEAEGVVAIYDARTNALISRYTSGEGGFARTAIRALAYSRATHDIPYARPITLQRAAGGRLYLHDPETGKTIDLDAFGAGNAAEFHRLIDAPDLSAVEVSEPDLKGGRAS